MHALVGSEYPLIIGRVKERQTEEITTLDLAILSTTVYHLGYLHCPVATKVGVSYLLASSGNEASLKTDETSVFAFRALTSGEVPAGSPVTLICKIGDTGK